MIESSVSTDPNDNQTYMFMVFICTCTRCSHSVPSCCIHVRDWNEKQSSDQGCKTLIVKSSNPCTLLQACTCSSISMCPSMYRHVTMCMKRVVPIHFNYSSWIYWYSWIMGDYPWCMSLECNQTAWETHFIWLWLYQCTNSFLDMYRRHTCMLQARVPDRESWWKK